MLKPVVVWAGKNCPCLSVCFCVRVVFRTEGSDSRGFHEAGFWKNGDVTLVNRIVYDATAPKRGDIIVFKPKEMKIPITISNECRPSGETVEIIEGKVYIDGERLEEDYETTEITDVGIVDKEIELAGDEFFVLGMTARTVRTAEWQILGM